MRYRSAVLLGTCSAITDPAITDPDVYTPVVAAPLKATRIGQRHERL